MALISHDLPEMDEKTAKAGESPWKPALTLRRDAARSMRPEAPKGSPPTRAHYPMIEP